MLARVSASALAAARATVHSRSEARMLITCCRVGAPAAAAAIIVEAAALCGAYDAAAPAGCTSSLISAVRPAASEISSSSDAAISEFAPCGEPLRFLMGTPWMRLPRRVPPRLCEGWMELPCGGCCCMFLSFVAVARNSF